MNFLSMEYFEAVARKRSITRAAEELHITQQTLSAHIAALENELGCRLFIRRTPLELTYAGEVFLEYAAAFSRDYSAMRSRFAGISGNLCGRLRIGVAHTRGRAIMPEIIRAFQRRYPNIEVCLAEAVNAVLLQRLRDGELDLAVAALPAGLAGVEREDFYDENIVMLVPRAFAPEERTEPTLASLAERPFLLSSPADISGRIARACIKRAGFKPLVRVQSDNVETLIALCAAGEGVCFCPENLLRVALTGEQLASIRVVHLADAACRIHFGYRTEPNQRELIEAFMAAARGQMERI